ncbi:MAG: nitrile hydratase subunit beta [Halobacterium sp.]
MDGIHDVGGMDGFGSLPSDEPEDASPFHEPWEGRVEALFLACLSQGVFGLDDLRATLERHDPVYYLSTPYYERWQTALEELLFDAGVVDREELVAAIESADDEVPIVDGDGPSFEELLAGVQDAYDAGGDYVEPTYEVGDRVRVKNDHPTGHTRCPRYARGVVGEVTAHRGTQVLPDANAAGDPRAEPLYNVRFDADDLWGADHTDATAVRLECWESYLTDPEADRHD